jgi:hypothetical protein
MPQIYFVRAVVKMIVNTHRHPANRALHLAGAPLYVVGLAMVIGYFAGMRTEPGAGAAMWLAAVAMFVAGHRIEGNVGSMTPVLLARLLSKTARDFVAQRVHLLRA